MSRRSFRSLFLVIALATASIFAAAPGRAAVTWSHWWGSFGTGDGQFSNPIGIARDADDNLYVTDEFNNRVEKFDRNGVFVAKWGKNGGDGSSGTGNGEFNQPIGIAVDPAGSVYVADSQNNRVEKFDLDGGYVTAWTTPSVPFGLAVAPDGDVYVSFFTAGIVAEYTSAGSFVSNLTAPGTLSVPEGLVVDPSGDVWVVDQGNSRIAKFDPTGVLLAQAGGFGNHPGQFNQPGFITLDDGGDVYVTDTGNSRVERFTSDGDLLRVWGYLGTSDADLDGPNGIAVSGDSVVAVVNYSLNRVTAFAQTPAAVASSSSVALKGKRPKTLTIRNAGDWMLDISSVSVTRRAFRVVSDTCVGQTVDLDRSCSIVIRGPGTNARGTLRMLSDDPDSPLSIPLSAR